MAHIHASFDLNSRWLKAEKIRRLLGEEGKVIGPIRLLEVGTGSGTIAHYFSRIESGQYTVSAVDVSDQRQIADGYAFTLYDGDKLPFPDQSFDIVISNHVIEHVGNRAAQSKHLAEISRVLASGGNAYLATPSRWQIIEPHFRLPFLSWLPRKWRDAYVRLAGKGEHYDCDPLTHSELEQLLGASGLRFRNANVAALRATLDMEARRSIIAAAIGQFPRVILEKVYRFSPTMVYLLAIASADDTASLRVPPT